MKACNVVRIVQSNTATIKRNVVEWNVDLMWRKCGQPNGLLADRVEPGLVGARCTQAASHAGFLLIAVKIEVPQTREVNMEDRDPNHMLDYVQVRAVRVCACVRVCARASCVRVYVRVCAYRRRL